MTCCKQQKKLARAENKTVGEVLTRLARKALKSTEDIADQAQVIQETKAHYGFKPFTARAIVTNHDIDRLRDEEGI